MSEMSRVQPGCNAFKTPSQPRAAFPNSLAAHRVPNFLPWNPRGEPNITVLARSTPSWDWFLQTCYMLSRKFS